MPIARPTVAAVRTLARGRRRKLAQSGQVLVLVALGLTLMLGIAGLVIDGGIAAVQRRDSRNAPDAGALAGAQDLPGVPATPAAAQQTAAQSDAITVNGGGVARVGVAAAVLIGNGSVTVTDARLSTLSSLNLHARRAMTPPLALCGFGWGN
jgi:Flp pilus assembly protein TadG